MTNGFGTRTAAGPLGRLPSLPSVERTEHDRVVAGVCSGIALALGVDATVVRLVSAILALAGGSGIVLYLGAWLLPPPPGKAERRAVAKGAGIGLLLIAGLFAMRGLGLEDSLLISAALIAAGIVLVSPRGRAGRGRVSLALGGVLVVVGTVIYVNETGGPFGGDAGPLAPGAVAIALAAVVGPWLWQLARERDAERLERIRSQERADVAARVHDSVLQTLALVQRDAEDPRRVATVARQQERGLRGWLYGHPSQREGTVVAAVERAAADVEQLHGVRVDVVTAGDAPLDDALDALVLAAREAMTNAAKFSGAEEVSVYVEAAEVGVTAYVRDRGRGFDLDAVADDRMGVKGSIVNRMARHGGTATVRSRPGEGTEVRLEITR